MSGREWEGKLIRLDTVTYHEEDSGHRDHEAAEFVCEGLERLWFA